MLTRRRMLELSGLGVLSLGAPACGLLATPATVFEPLDSDATLTSPEVLTSQDGLLSITLVAARGARIAGRDTRALGFNGGSPGPTLRVRPGDELAVRLVNQLEEPTNLHTHGLQVSPQGNSDNPFLHIAPGEAFDYRFAVGADHPPGTGWYHPHHHGLVADQLFGGLAGALLVDGGPDVPVAADRVMLLSDITLDAAGRVVSPAPSERMIGREGALVLVNGQYRPSIPSRPGTVERWRIINACVSRILDLRLDRHDLAHIALDGSYLAAPAPLDRLVLAPGNRSDVLVRPVRAGSFPLWITPYPRGSMPGMNAPVSTDPAVVATLTVTGAPVAAAPLPLTLPAAVVPAGATGQERRIRFAMGRGQGGMRPTIDGLAFDPDRDDQQVRLGTVEEWTITNTGPFVHPFHIHVWPFTVLATSDGQQPTGVPQDVVLVPPGGWVRIRIPFTRYPGRTVYHCHILDHEDAGMMATVVVSP
jgi:FtsP/CotA-like multicopper oxidase with cupredoxin domain